MAYGRRITGEGPTYRERHKGRVQCGECRGEDGGRVFGGSQDDSAWESGRGATDLEKLGHGGRAADLSNGLSTQGSPAELPVGGMHGPSGNEDGNSGSFLNRHVLDTMVILEEGNLPHPRCTQCNILVPRRTLNSRYPSTAKCARGAERKMRRLAEAELRESSERAFEAYGEPLENVTVFRYLVRVLTAGDDYWLAVVSNLGKAIKSWGRLSRILSREGADPKVLGNFTKRWRRLCCCSGRRRGCLPLGWSGTWIASSTGLRDGLPGGILVTDFLMGRPNYHPPVSSAASR